MTVQRGDVLGRRWIGAERSWVRTNATRFIPDVENSLHVAIAFCQINGRYVAFVFWLFVVFANMQLAGRRTGELTNQIQRLCIETVKSMSITVKITRHHKSFQAQQNGKPHWLWMMDDCFHLVCLSQ